MTMPEISPATKERYLLRRRTELDHMRKLLSEQEYSLIREFAHQIKGNGATFGFPELSEHAEKLESAAQSLLHDEARHELEWMDGWLKSLGH
jgi:HPt (histidine-containing phosphotransfer) domain-containing protein